MSEARICPRCLTRFTAESLTGLCPRCVLEKTLATPLLSQPNPIRR
jgi:hypothetical protein